MDRIAEMLVEVKAGRALDVRREGFETATEGTYRLRRFVSGKRYADLARGRWIASIGESMVDGRIFAAIDARFADGPNFSVLYTSN